MLADHARSIGRFLRNLRRAILGLLASVAALTVAIFPFSPRLCLALQNHLQQDLVFYTVSEPFLAHVQLSLCAALALLVPASFAVLWTGLADHFGMGRPAAIAFTACTTVLFYAGAAFCALFTLPYGIEFLLGFQSEQLKAAISIGRFVNFVTLFILSFGMIFELPVFMVFAARTRLLPLSAFQSGRRYAVLGISIAAALLTPTPDIFNMMLMAVPLYGLYEAGILAIRLAGPR